MDITLIDGVVLLVILALLALLALLPAPAASPRPAWQPVRHRANRASLRQQGR